MAKMKEINCLRRQATARAWAALEIRKGMKLKISRAGVRQAGSKNETL